MNRRDFLGSTLMASLVGGMMTDRAFAQQTPGGPAAAPGAARRIPLHAYSRYLHWLRTPKEVAEACRELSCGYLMVTVQDGESAHVQQSDLRRQLPRFVKALRAEGIDVQAIRGGNQTAVDRDVQRLVGTMADLGITRYWLGTDRYDFSQPILPQLDAIKRKVEGFVELNERYGTTLMYHTRSGASSVGSVVWDLLYVLREFDPGHVGLHWDTGHMSNHGSMWETLYRTAAPYVVAVSWKDRVWKQDLGGLTEQGGPFPGPQLVEEQPRGPRGFGGPPRRNANPLDEVPLPLAGEHFARGMGWSSEETPLGTGIVDFFRYGEVLRETGFNGIMDVQAEYPLGGAERGLTELSLPRRLVLGALKRDVLTVRVTLAQSGSGISV
ncbi:MAG TPA: TIM barrel protein [Woeseiaceae bacterium]